MRTITCLAGMVALGFTFGMVVLYGYTGKVSIKLIVDDQIPAYNRQMASLTAAYSRDKDVRQNDTRTDINATVKTLHQNESVDEIDTSTNHSTPSNVIPNSTLKLYRIQNEVSDIHACPAPDLGKPNPSLTQCLLEAIHAIPDKAFPDDLRIFNPTFSIDIHMELLELLEVFHQEVTSHNLTYFLAGGTLIGSWRHHGFIPWDDDADVYLDVQDKPRLKEALSKLPPRYGRFTKDGAKRWKLYMAKRHQFENKTNNWASPFLDICFYKQNGTYIQDIDRGFRKSRYEIDSVFPVVPRPFYHLMLPSPQDTAKVLSKEYKISQTKCRSAWRDHRKRKGIKSSITSCSNIHPYFPFVNHEHRKEGSLEYLEINERVLYLFETK